MTPQTQLVLKHLCYAGSLTGAEASTVHRIRHLPRRIADLKEWGVPIVTEMKRDMTGQRYASYSIRDWAAQAIVDHNNRFVLFGVAFA